MKGHLLIVVLGVVLASFLFHGYQCGSPEFTGAKVHIQQKNYKEAIRLLEIEVQKNPANEEAWFFLGGLKADEADYDGMNRAFNEAMKLSNKHTAEIRAIRYNHWGQNLNSGVNFLERASSDSAEYFDKAIGAFDRSIKAWPDTSLTYRYLAYAYNNRGDFDNALVAFNKAWDVGQDMESIKRVGRIRLVKGDEHKSKFETDNALSLRALKNLDETKRLTNKNDVMRVLGAPDNITKGPKGTKKEEWVYNTYKVTFSIDGDKVLERKFGEPAYRPHIDSTEYHLAQEEYDKAVQALETARDADPSSKLSKGMSEQGVERLLGPPDAKTQTVYENIDVTLWDYKLKGVQVYLAGGTVKGFTRPAPDNELLQSLLKAYIESNRIEPAVRAFERAVASDPQNKTNHYILGVLYRTINKFDEAIAQFKETLRLDPNDCDALFDLAATYYNWGVDIIKAADEKGEPNDAYKEKFQAALPYMEKVTECKKDDVNVWETLGTVYARLGQQDKAMKAFEQADKIRKGM